MKTIPLKLKQNMGIAIGSIALFSSLPSYALTVQEVPNPRQTNGGWVTDSANILSDRAENQLNQMISQLESENGTEIAVVTVPETSPSPSPKEFATELFNYWGIGKRDRDNGILLLISVGERRTEIETGYGIESILPDAKVGNIIETQITPQFKQKHFDEGTLAGTQALIIAVEDSENQELRRINSSDFQQEQYVDRNISTEKNSNLTGLIVLLLSPVLIVYALVLLRRVYVKPSEVEIRLWGNGNRPVFCATCKQKMERVDKHQVDKELSKPEKVAQEIGSVKFEGWKCSKCSHHPVIIGYTSLFSGFKKCHNCHELTVTHTRETLKYPTHYEEGKRLVTEKCHCCGYYREQQVIIPRLPSPSPSHSRSNNTWIITNGNSDSNDGSSYSNSSSSYDSSSSYSDSSSSYYDSSSSGSSGSSYDSSSSSSGGDFGGGSSGGGGAGDSW